MSEAESNKERKAEGAEEPGLPAARDQDPHPLTDQGTVIAALSKTTGGLTHVHLRDVQDEHVTPMVRPKHPDEVDMPGQVDRYQILGEIARGGFGVIYKARDVDVGRELALKVLLADHEKNPVLVRRFVEEAQIGGQLQHPGIVPVHNMGLVAGGKPYFTMKLVKGQTLAALLGARGDPTEDRLRFLGVFEQVAETLAYAHARKVIHRDLKPANIMVGAFGEVQVMDWGLSKVLGQTRDADRAAAEIARTQISVIETIRTGSSGSDSLAGSVLGTPAYMAPEQARGEVDDLDARADVFGLGAILCEILTGMPPYVADSVTEIHLQAKRGYLDDATERLDACGADKELVSLAKTCLAYEPRERPTDASVVTRKIHEYLASLEERARSSALEAAEAHVRAEGERRARKLSLALAVVLVAVLSVGTRGYLWLEGVSADRLRKASTATSRALEEAVTLHAQAKAAGYLDLARWEAAVTAAEAAGALAAGARPDLQQRTAELVSEARRDVERSRQATALDAKNRRLLDALESLRGDHADNSSYTRNEPGYAAAFSEYGIDIDRLEPQEAAERLAESGIAVELAETLDHWGKSRKSARPGDTEGWKKLFRIGQLLDPDPWRRRLRKALEDEDVDEMRQLVASPELMYAPARTLELLGTTLRQRGDHARAEWVYRVARDRYPDDFWINHDLHRFLHNQPFEYAALASRPRSAHAWSDAAALLRAKSDPEETLAAAIDILKNSDRSEEWQWRALVSVLEKGEGQDFGSTLEGTILWLDRLVSSGGEVHELAGEVFALAWSLRPDVLPASSILEFARAQVRDAGGGDASALAFLAAVHFGMEETHEAVRIQEQALSISGGSASLERKLGDYRRAALPDLPTYDSIDAVFETPEEIISEGETWRYFEGLTEPSPGLEWTRAEFDDSGWQQGPSGFGYGDGDDRTVLREMRFRYTTVYIRKTFEVSDPDRDERLVLSVRYDDGFVAYLNGREVGRENAPGEKDVPFPFDAGTIIRFESAQASTPITLPKDHLVRGRNVLALHGLNSGVTSSDLTLIPIVRGDPPTDADEIVKRFAAFREAAKGEDAPRRLAYLDGRLLQRVGKHEEAVVKFDGILSAEQTRPVLRLTESLLAVGNPVAAESRLRGVLEAGIVEDPALCDEWLRVCLVELRRDPRAVLAEFPRVPAGDRGNEDRLENVKWLLGQLSTSGAVRINCGGGDHTARDGTLWGRDRFFSGGFRFFGDGESGATGPFTDDIVDTDDDPLYQTERWFPSVAPYRIPVPPGDYRVTLHFAEIVNTQKGSRFFDVRLEDRLVLLDYDPTMAGFATADRRSFPVEIRDGVLDLEFVHQLDYPKISAIEIVREE